MEASGTSKLQGELAKLNSPWATEDLIKTVANRIKPLSGRIAVLVNLDKQTEDWGDGILIPDRVQALQDRSGKGTPRCGTVAVSGTQDVVSGEHWLVDADEGQWWLSPELELQGISIPSNWQLRLYMDTTPLLVRLNNDN